MSKKISFSCPKCSNKNFSSDRNINSLDDFRDATCSKCGHKVSKNDVVKQATKIAEKQIRDALKGILK